MRHRSRHLVLSSLLTLSAMTAALFVPAATFAATPTTGAATATTTTCDEGRWPAAAQGQPWMFKAGASAGDYLWHNGTGWHLRITHPGSARIVFTGTIVADTALSVTSYKFESGDSFTLSADHKTLTYRVVNHGRIDGLDFRTACATRLWIRGSMAGHRLALWRIRIGHAGHHPLQNPFVILRNR